MALAGWFPVDPFHSRPLTRSAALLEGHKPLIPPPATPTTTTHPSPLTSPTRPPGPSSSPPPRPATSNHSRLIRRSSRFDIRTSPPPVLWRPDASTREMGKVPEKQCREPRRHDTAGNLQPLAPGSPPCHGKDERCDNGNSSRDEEQESLQLDLSSGRSAHAVIEHEQRDYYRQDDEERHGRADRSVL